MPDIIITISPASAGRISEALNSVYPIPQIINPDYEADPQPNNPSANPSDYDYDYDFDTPQYINEFGDLIWAKKVIREFLRSTTERYETRRDMNTAKKAVNVPDGITS